MEPNPESENNRIPHRVERIHLTAVCGTGMGALAGMLKDLGFQVTGSDQNVYPPMSDFLADKRIRVTSGYGPQNLDPRPDLVVIGNVVSRGNPEVEAVLKLGLPYCSMPQALNHFITRGKRPVVIAGTHGKTTTAAMTAWILHRAGLDPSFMIGGILKNFGSSYRLGEGQHIVIEGDEYDTAFFDKGPKFNHYTPELAVLTSVEFDHADIFRDLEHVRAIFKQWITRIPKQSTLLAYDADENIPRLVVAGKCRVETYGDRPDSSWQLQNSRFEPPWSEFEVIRGDRFFGRFRSPVMGKHNLANLLAAIAISHHSGVSAEAIAAALEGFEGIKRRQEIRGVKNGITVMDDFAHHPTAVRATVTAIRSFYPRNRIVAVFEPRTNTSMRSVFQGVYPTCFDAADLICIRKPPLLQKIPAGQRFSSEKLVEDLQRRGKAAFFFEETDAVIEYLGMEARPGDIVLIMSNGGFDNIHSRLLARL